MHYYQHKVMLYFKDYGQQTIYQNELARMPIDKQAFRDQCMALYASEEPCAMKQTAVSFRIYTQLDDYIQSCLLQKEQTEILWLEIPASIRRWLHLPDECRSLVHSVQVTTG